MGRRKLRIFNYLAALGLAVLVIAIPAYASSPPLTVEQDVEELSKTRERQAYRFSCSLDGKDETEYTGCIEIAYGEGFHAESLRTGEWGSYDGILEIQGYSRDEREIFTMSDTVREDIDISGYENVSKIVITMSERMPGATGIHGLEVSGEIGADEAGREIKVSGRYCGIDEDGSKVLLGEGDVATVCNRYQAGTPEIKVAPDSVDYLGDTEFSVSRLSGEGFSTVSEYTVLVHIPERMYVDNVCLPDFDNAGCTLYADGERQDTKDTLVYMNRRMKELKLKIMPGAGNFTQTGDMAVRMRNTGREEGEEQVYVTVSYTYGNGISDSVDSEMHTIRFKEASEDKEDDGNKQPDEEGKEEDKTVQPIPERPGAGAGASDAGLGVGTNAPEEDAGNVRKEDADRGKTRERIHDYTGMDLRSAKVTSASRNTMMDFRSSKAGSSKNQPADGGRIKTTEIEEFDSGRNPADGGSSSDIFSDIKKTPSEEVRAKVKQTWIEKIKENPFIQIVGIFIILSVMASMVIVFILGNTEGKEGANQKGE